MLKVEFKKLSKAEQKLIKTAERARLRAYAPYSGFQVGAAVLTRNNVRISGANYESASYGDSICAERAALLRANSQGYGDKCVAIAVVVKNKDSPSKKKDKVSAPCGSCRQLILEAAERSKIGGKFKIIMATVKPEKVKISTIGELLPYHFGPNDLKN